MSMYLILTQIIGKKFKLVIIGQDQDVGILRILLKVSCMYLEVMTVNFHSMIFGCCILVYKYLNRVCQENY